MSRPDRGISLFYLSLIAVGVGVVTGAVGLFFRQLIAFLHNVFFFGVFSLEERTQELTPIGPWGPWIILVPVVGGLGAIFLLRHFAPEARGGGVPEVMDAIYYRDGRIRPRVALVKSLASALSIGSGASVGREGPIIQIGSTFGSGIAQALGLAAWQRFTLLACGAGSAIAATFNTPLGGVMFAIELMMPEVSARTFLPVVLATGTATYVGRLAYGAEPAFVVAFGALPDTEPLSMARLAGFLGLGMLSGLGAFAFIRVVAWLDHWFPRLPINPYWQHALGMALVGVMMYLLAYTYGYYFIEGTGHGTIQAILGGEIEALSLFALLFLAKLLATAISLSSGAAGGIISPTLLLGSSLGAWVGAALGLLWPEAGFSILEYAIVGMASMLGGATGAPMTAIVAIFERTRDYNIIVPMIMATAVALGVRRYFLHEDIYTIKLAARGHLIPKERDTNMFTVRHADEVMEPAFDYLPAKLDRDQARAQVEAMSEAPRFFVLYEGNRIVGVTSYHEVVTHQDEEGIDTLDFAVPRLPFVLARSEDMLNDVIERLGRDEWTVALVVAKRGIPRVGDICGVISVDEIGHQVLRSFHDHNAQG